MIVFFLFATFMHQRDVVQSMHATSVSGSETSTPSDSTFGAGADADAEGDEDSRGGSHAMHWGLLSALLAVLPLCCLGALLLARCRYRRRRTKEYWHSTELPESKLQGWPDIPNAVRTHTHTLFFRIRS
jgi:hypothetical protein